MVHGDPVWPRKPGGQALGWSAFELVWQARFKPEDGCLLVETCQSCFVFGVVFWWVAGGSCYV